MSPVSYAANSCQDPLNTDPGWWLRNCPNDSSVFVEDPAAAAQRFAALLSYCDETLCGPYWFVINNGDGSYTVQCSNYQVNIRFHGPPPTPGPTEPPYIPPPSCNQPCTTDQACVVYDDQGGGGCRKCVIPPAPPQGNCPTGQHPYVVGEPRGGGAGDLPPTAGTCEQL